MILTRNELLHLAPHRCLVILWLNLLKLPEVSIFLIIPRSEHPLYVPPDRSPDEAWQATQGIEEVTRLN